MAKITTTPDGGLSVEVSDDADVNELGADDGLDGGMGPDIGDEEFDAAGMEPVDTVEGGDMDDEMGPEMGGEMDEMDPEMGGEMPDYEGDDALEPGDEEDVNDGMGPDEEELPFEDKDITEPQSSKYTKHVKDNKRDMPDHKLTKASDDKLDSIGPDVKKDDGSGTKPPTAKSMSNK
jgi:hypothetical protein